MYISTLMRNVLKVNPHVPLIRFRKGQKNAGRDHGQSSSAVSPGFGKHHSSSVTIEDHQLPARFRRLPLDETEIEIINSGGCPPDPVIKKK